MMVQTAPDFSMRTDMVSPWSSIGKSNRVLEPPRLPPSIRVLVRGMLNCNQVVLREAGENVLIDSGYCTHRERTLELIAGPLGLDGEPLERLINTHCHTDHMGGNAAVASAH